MTKNLRMGVYLFAFIFSVIWSVCNASEATTLIDDTDIKDVHSVSEKSYQSLWVTIETNPDIDSDSLKIYVLGQESVIRTILLNYTKISSLGIPKAHVRSDVVCGSKLYYNNFNDYLIFNLYGINGGSSSLAKFYVEGLTKGDILRVYCTMYPNIIKKITVEMYNNALNKLEKIAEQQNIRDVANIPLFWTSVNLKESLEVKKDL
jgi:hypothetical protein